MILKAKKVFNKLLKTFTSFRNGFSEHNKQITDDGENISGVRKSLPEISRYNKQKKSIFNVKNNNTLLK